MFLPPMVLLIPRLRTLSVFRDVLCLRRQIHGNEATRLQVLSLKAASPDASTSKICAPAPDFFNMMHISTFFARNYMVLIQNP